VLNAAEIGHDPDEIEIEELEVDRANPWRHTTIVAIGPEGQINIRHVPHRKSGEAGDMPIVMMDGRPVVHPRWAAKGWVLYKDMCAGRVPGVPADADAWRRWESLKALRAAGQEVPAGALVDDLDLWHPEVKRRRAKAKGPVATIADIRALFPGIPLVDDHLDFEDDGT
jgi:hypothetical protein